MKFSEYIGRPALAESILDRPKEGLDPDVWAVNAEGEHVPTIQASQKIDAVVQWAVAKFGITDPIVHVTGSIASNSYGDKSDVDLHFCSETFEPDDPDAFNKEFRAAFAEEFGPETGSENGFIGVHPIEVYFQVNPFQDMMSVGCYDYLNRKWESGPELKDTAFDPYSEYYEKDMKHVQSIVKDVRSVIFEAYEKALVLRKATDGKFVEKLYGKLVESLKDAGELFEKIRTSRKVMSSPKSKEAALKMRKSRKWHVADSAFKLFDRFGYIAILKEYTDLSKEELPPAETVAAVVSAVQENVVNNKMITDAEREQVIGEGEVPGMPGWDEDEIKQDVTAWLLERIADYQLDIELLGVAVHGSRMKGTHRPDSDLDVIVYYRGTRPDGKNAREDHVWNMLNDKPGCDVDGVPVDFWPTRDEESGNLQDALAKAREVDEGVGSALRSMALAGMMLAPGFAGAAEKAKSDTDRPAAVQQAGNAISYAGLSRANMTNLLATIAYNEAMQDWMKNRDDDAIIAILNVIDNRAGGDPNHYAEEISAKSQFFSAKHVKGGYVDRTYKRYNPQDEAKAGGGQLSPKQKECWDLCVQYADQLLSKTLPGKIGDRNMIANPAKDKKSALDAWGNKCDLAVEGHVFGYDKKHDGYIKYGKKKPANLTHAPIVQKIYVVKKGDNLWNIAKANGTTVDSIKTKNGLKSDVIRPGQELKV